MNLELKKRSRLKRNIIIGLASIAVLAGAFTLTHNKYETTESVEVANDKINYELADKNLIGVYLQDGDNYTKSDTIPESGYELNEEESYCKVNDEVDNNISITYDTNSKTLSITPMTTKGTKCYLYFDEQRTLLKDAILANSKRGTGTPDFNKTSCTNGSNIGEDANGNCGEQTVGLYEETTNKGTTYYYRGDVEDNYLVFAGFYWRIIRINKDGSIRIIYSGEKSEVDAAGKEKVLANGYNDGSTMYTQIAVNDSGTKTSAYNSSYNHSEYVGYTYVERYQRPSDSPDTEPTSSTIKGVLDTWYGENLQEYDSYIDGNAGFCNDRDMASESSWSSQPSSNIDYKASERIETTYEPTYECKNANDLYQTKIGLITADEVAYAGGKYVTSNYGYYLYTGNAYWTMSPHRFGYNYAEVYVVYANGVYIDWVNSDYGVRPVINLNADVTITGGVGTLQVPYVVN